MTYIKSFSQLNINDIPCAGGKGANLGEMTAAGFPVSPGFVLTTEAYDAFVEAHGLQKKIVQAATGVQGDNPQSSERAACEIQALFLKCDITPEIADRRRYPS